MSKYYELSLATNESRKVYFSQLFSMGGVESALWPILYYDRSLCESYISGSVNRQTTKTAFMNKCFSEIVDYI